MVRNTAFYQRPEVNRERQDHVLALEMSINLLSSQQADPPDAKTLNHRCLEPNFYVFADSPADLQAYQCPRYFQDDWLNNYFDVLCKEPSDSKPSASDGVIDSDYRFVYLGKKVTYSHAQNPTVAPFPVFLCIGNLMALVIMDSALLDLHFTGWPSPNLQLQVEYTWLYILDRQVQYEASCNDSTAQIVAETLCNLLSLFRGQARTLPY